MKKENKTLDNAYFDKVYTEKQDPWNFEKSEYEKDKYLKTLDSLPKKKYHKGLEIGCSIGVLTKLLADRCNELMSIDLNEFALASAKERLKEQSNVTLKIGSIPDDLPKESFDLVVMSEVGYYLSIDDLIKAKDEIKLRMIEDADLILVHWTHEVADYPLSGDQVNECFLGDKDFKLIINYRSPDYRLDVLSKN